MPIAITRLEAALASGQLPDSSVKIAKRLLKLLGNPVRIAVLGLSGSGKSKILNFLAGEDIIPGGVEMPTLQLSDGPELKVACTLPDGSTRSLDKLDTAEISRLAPVFVHIEMPLPALKKISLLEVVMGVSPNEQQRALAWAARRADIALWCAQDFTEAESVLWEALPDALKDHSFLVVTKADEMTLPGELTERIEEIREFAEDSFHGVFPVATLQAIAARGEDGAVDKERLTTSGGQALIAAILHDVEQAHEAALASAEILFGQHNIKDVVVEQPVEQPVDEVPATESAPAPEIAVKPDVEPAPKEEGIFNTDIVSHLATLASDLTKKLNEPGPDTSTEILEQCLECAKWLLEQLSDLTSQYPDLSEAVHTCQDAIDFMVLMQMEKQDDNTVIDAVSLLLQIKRDFEVKIAA